MAEFLTTYGTSYRIEGLIKNANRRLVLLSPYLQISKTLLERIKDASSKEITIQIVYGKDELKANERKSLSKIKGLELFFFENLHAKCYFNENEMVITSMNMYEFSEKNNREMGVYVKRSEDKNLFESAVSEAESIIQSSEKETLIRVQEKPILPKQIKLKTKKGSCIHCGEAINLDIDRPYCRNCFTTWSKYRNENYEEEFCHGCGEVAKTSMAKPFCYTCFKEYAAF